MKTIDELDEQTRQCAIEKLRENWLDYEWWNCVYDDAKAVGSLMGFSIDEIYFSGFCSQGDGACFTGEYGPVDHSVLKVVASHPQDEELRGIALALQDLQNMAGGGVSASIDKGAGNYSHEYSVGIELYDSMGDYALSHLLQEDNDVIYDPFRRFMRWIYRRLEEDYDYLRSDESIIDGCRANEYLFDEEGDLHG